MNSSEFFCFSCKQYKPERLRSENKFPSGKAICVYCADHKPIGKSTAHKKVSSKHFDEYGKYINRTEQ